MVRGSNHLGLLLEPLAAAQLAVGLGAPRRDDLLQRGYLLRGPRSKLGAGVSVACGRCKLLHRRGGSEGRDDERRGDGRGEERREGRAEERERERERARESVGWASRHLPRREPLRLLRARGAEVVVDLLPEVGDLLHLEVALRRQVVLVPDQLVDLVLLSRGSEGASERGRERGSEGCEGKGGRNQLVVHVRGAASRVAARGGEGVRGKGAWVCVGAWGPGVCESTCPIERPAPCSTRRERLEISDLSCEIVSLARASFS